MVELLRGALLIDRGNEESVLQSSKSRIPSTPHTGPTCSSNLPILGLRAHAQCLLCGALSQERPQCVCRAGTAASGQKQSQVISISKESGRDLPFKKG